MYVGFLRGCARQDPVLKLVNNGFSGALYRMPYPASPASARILDRQTRGPSNAPIGQKVYQHITQCAILAMVENRTIVMSFAHGLGELS